MFYIFNLIKDTPSRQVAILKKLPIIATRSEQHVAVDPKRRW